jgi:hypothetical protein
MSSVSCCFSIVKSEEGIVGISQLYSSFIIRMGSPDLQLVSEVRKDLWV